MVGGHDLDLATQHFAAEIFDRDLRRLNRTLSAVVRINTDWSLRMPIHALCRGRQCCGMLESRNCCGQKLDVILRSRLFLLEEPLIAASRLRRALNFRSGFMQLMQKFCTAQQIIWVRQVQRPGLNRPADNLRNRTPFPSASRVAS